MTIYNKKSELPEACVCAEMKLQMHALQRRHTQLMGRNAQFVQRNACLIVDRALIEAYAAQDPLTKLYRRNVLDQRLEQVIENAKAGKLDNQRIVFMMIDVDDFKKYNDTGGHIFGDGVLKNIADHISHAVRGEQLGIRHEDIVARWAGDEFAILWVDDPIHSSNSVRPIAKRIMDAQKFPISIGVFSIWGSQIREEGLTSKDITDAADKLLYEAKKNKLGRIPACLEWTSSKKPQPLVLTS